ncbi:MAG: SurA N-terminal domain-containing protein [Rickettsiales bacterium]|jgi:peptidyl-prolyl cis-trans isomerase D|nr:SurA N-terminal domain-containing protein [Rickettsiales bacterium]
MLEYLRNGANSKLGKFLLGLLTFSFVGWGVADWVLGGGASDDAIMRVGGDKITQGQFEREKSNQMSRLSKPQQKQIYTEPAAAREFYGQVLSTLTTRAYLECRANDLGFRVSDREIANIIKRTPDFQESGQFASYKFDRMLSDIGLTERGYAAILRATVLREMVLGGLNISAPVPEFAATALYNARYKERGIEYSAVSFADFKATGNPTDEQLQEIYARNPKIIPETRTASYVLIPADMAQPDSYDKGYARAQKTEDAIISGEPLDAAAKANGAKFVALGSFAAARHPADPVLTDSVVAKIFTMDEGIESEIIETKQGFAIIRVEKIAPAHNADFNTVRGELTALWRAEQQKKQAYLRANELLIKLNEKNTLDNKKTATISRAAGGVPTDVLVAAFANPVGAKTIVAGQGAYYVLNVRNEILPKAAAAKLNDLSKEAKNMLNRGVQDDYMNFLQHEYPVKVNEKMFQRVVGK